MFPFPAKNTDPREVESTSQNKFNHKCGLYCVTCTRKDEILFPSCFVLTSSIGKRTVCSFWPAIGENCLESFIKINPFPHNDTFWRPWETSLLKTLREKEKLLVTSNFSFFHSVCCPFRELSDIFIKFKIVVWRLFQTGPVSNFVVW